MADEVFLAWILINFWLYFTHFSFNLYTFICNLYKSTYFTVNHKILLSVLEHNFGLEQTVLNWFSSYLNHRSCKVNIRKEYSLSWHLPFSVPQGSCVDAQLFNLYCSSIQDLVGPPLTLHGFADDHTVGNKFKPGNCSDETRCMDELEKCATDLKI